MRKWAIAVRLRVDTALLSMVMGTPSGLSEAGGAADEESSRSDGKPLHR